MQSRRFSFLAVVWWFALLVGSDAEEQDSEQDRRPIKTFTTIYGEIIDCVDMYKQPAFDHPLLKDHKLQKKPSFSFNAQVKQLERSDVSDGCPEGTIPILRRTKVNLTRADLVEQTPAQIYHTTAPGTPGFHFAFLDLDFTSDYPIHGAKAFIDNYIPKCAKGQMSGALIYVISDFKNPTNAIHVGWRVQPDLFQDDKSHLFTFWRGQNGTGCNDLLCPGFVQVDRSITLGQVIQGSTYGGPQVETHLAVQQDPNTKDWWLVFERNNFHVNVGYWPAKLLPDLTNGARGLNYGGVTQTANGVPFPPMGSGFFPDNSYSHACYFRQIHYIDGSQNWVVPKRWQGSAHTTSKACYGATLNNVNEHMGYTLLFGGPGGNGCGA